MSDAGDLLLDGFDRIGASVPRVLDGPGTDDAAWRPGGSGNSVGWLVWHLTRVIDDHVASAFDEEQVHTAQGYAARLGLDLPADDTGYGHGDAQVDAVRFGDVPALADYHRAVQERFGPLLAGVTDLGAVIDDRWDPPVTLGVRLVSVLDDAARHVGQAEYVRGLLDARGPAED